MVYIEKGGKGNGYREKGIYATQAMPMQRMGQVGYMQGIPPSWHSETAGQFSLDQYHKELSDWHRMTTHLDPAMKMDMIVSYLGGRRSAHQTLVDPSDSSNKSQKVASLEVRQ